MSPATLELLGFAAAVLTTLCWLPQAARVIRTRDTHAISLWTQAMFAAGILLWLVYGLALMSWPLIAANSLTLVLTCVILAMKLRHG